MGDAAHGEPSNNKIFTTPFKVEPQFEDWDTPGNYQSGPGGKRFPDKIKVWRVQNTGKDFGSVAGYSYGFEDSPDAEIIAAGYNVGKEYGAPGVSRHGNFMQWGFNGSPKQMTPAGRALFLNAICYINAYNGVSPLVGRGDYRMNALRLAAVLDRISNKDFGKNQFGEELSTKFKGNPQGLIDYYKNDYELIYRQGGPYTVDEELKSLGIQSNRRLSSLEKLIALLKDESKAAAARKLLARYTDQKFETPEQWQKWFESNKARMYFSDTGGFKFLVAPENYPVIPGRIGIDAPNEETWSRVFGN